jgi:hypothetical protein
MDGALSRFRIVARHEGPSGSGGRNASYTSRAARSRRSPRPPSQTMAGSNFNKHRARWAAAGKSPANMTSTSGLGCVNDLGQFLGC